MVFSSTIFLFVFLPCVFIAYWTVRIELRLYLLLFASLLFYTWGNPYHVIWLLLIALISYISAIKLDGASTTNARKFWVIAAIVFDLVVLFRYKYLGFFLQIIGNISGYTFTQHQYILPIGISFYTFQALSYVIDVYRREVRVQKNFMQLALYISFFPQLIAGPIVKYHDILPDIEQNIVHFDDISAGVKRFIIGLGKKVLIANQLGSTVDKVFGENVIYTDFSIAWLGAITYSLQLYYDFSGYSDMAIGLGRIFGFHFKENFSHPYLSGSITEFWRRWHISLGAWFREYLYIPLGGNRCGVTRTYVNLLFVFFVTGLWHGAAWTFVVWGLWHGTFVVAERLFVFGGGTNTWAKLFRHVYAILVVVFGWTMFRAESLSEGLLLWQAMLGLYTPDIMPFTIEYYLTDKLLLIIAISILGCTTWVHEILGHCAISQNVYRRIVADGYLFIVLFLSMSFLIASTYNPFIYFRF